MMTLFLLCTNGLLKSPCLLRWRLSDVRTSFVRPSKGVTLRRHRPTPTYTHTHTHTHDRVARDGVIVGVAVPLEPVPLIYDKQESREIGDVGMPVALKSAAAAAAEASLSHARALGRQSAFEEHEYQDRDPDDVEDVEC
mmetsp:Transcript_10555/g.16702  ORF Transcript_10555/g.16702 Transcript_10555/m.16702 type:complete len:139 (-) Transcript_10555:2-418(-)